MKEAKGWIRFLTTNRGVAEDFLKQLAEYRQEALEAIAGALRSGVSALPYLAALDFVDKIRQTVVSEMNEQLAQARYHGREKA